MGWGRTFPKVQILTVEELLDGKVAEIPPMRQTFTKAERIKGPPAQQYAMAGLFDE